MEPSDKDILAALSASEKGSHDQLTKEIDSIKKERREFTFGLLMTDTTEKVPPTRILYQGDHKAPREAVAPGFLSAFDPNPATISSAPNTQSTGRRLTFAHWIASAGNPLTARVLVNRVWQAYFGRGLVETPNDFGLAGAKPSQSELLDWLADEFLREGWSLKKLHRLIVTSRTYAQRSNGLRSPEVQMTSPASMRLASSASIKSNAAPSRHDVPRPTIRRLSAEQLRDSLLAISGVLTNKAGGPPVWPDLPAEVLQANPAFLDDNEAKTKGWYPSAKDQQPVRSIYLVQKKTVRVPFMETFDLPENSTSCARRSVSVVAPQALSLLNSPLAVEVAAAFARRVEREAGSRPQAQVRHAFQLALQREPTPHERLVCVNFLARHNLSELCRSLLNLNEFVYLD